MTTSNPRNELSDVSMQSCIDNYKRAGYEPIANNTSRISSEVLRHPTHSKIVKFGRDPAYDVFVTYAMKFPSEHFPQFHHHDKPAGEFKDSHLAFTLTEIEVLVPLSAEEESRITVWVNAVFEAKRNTSDPLLIPDAYGLTNDLLRLMSHAVNNSVNIDLLKTTNYMARETPAGRQIVFTDPYF